MARRRTFIAALAAVGFPGLRRETPRPILGAWSGAVTPHGASVVVLAARPGLDVTLATSDGASAPVRLSRVTDDLGVARFELSGLRERTRYRYAAEAPGGPPLDGGFRTFAEGSFSFRVLFASCARTGSTSDVFTSMREQRADLFVHMGDLHYEDIRRNDVARFREAYLAVHASPTQSALFRSLPLAYTWDDHDFGPNDSDRSSPSRPAALHAYRRFVPHYALDDDEDAPIHQAFDVGRVRFLITDVRSARSPRRLPPAERTMLGQRQLAWLEEQLESARSAPLVVWVNTVPWITKRDESTREGWAPYARERRTIADLVARLGLVRRLVMLSGDAHMLALDDGTHSQYSALPGAEARGFVVAHAAPMDRRPTRKGGPYSCPEVAQNGQYGVMDVADEGGPLRVRLQGMRGRLEVPGMRLELDVPS